MTAGLDTGYAGYAGPFKNLARYGPGAALQLVDFTYWQAGGVADSTGTVTLTSDAVPGDQFWIAERLFLDSSSLVIGRLDVYEGDSAAAQHRRDFSPVPYHHPLIRSYQPGVLFRSNRAILAIIGGLIAGDAVQLSLSYAVVKRVIAKGAS